MTLSRGQWEQVLTDTDGEELPLPADIGTSILLVAIVLISVLALHLV